MSDEQIERAKEKCRPLLDALWPGMNANIYVSWRLFERKWGCLVPGPKDSLWEGKGYETIEDALDHAVPELKELLRERISAKQREIDALSELLVEKQ